MSEREDVAFANGTDTCAAWLYRPEGVSGPDAKAGFDAIVPPDPRWRNEVAAPIMLRVATYRPVRSAAAVA
jgi:hypothetical protein